MPGMDDHGPRGNIENVALQLSPLTSPLNLWYGFQTSKFFTTFCSCLCVAQVSGSGQDAIFTGRLKAMPTDPSVVRVWMLLTGTIMCVEEAFGDMSGWRGAVSTA